ncbi:cornifelin homolog B-like [Thalassophryne amazonica]|uniref:cornifelin homolog B-like n=1 Tax=Thalassophryne amazonica TaxID=390379 RepID=UPI0014723118|nr:cornifelin homolog B-like [Thalassophryne amazonica]XP_034033773.1 cornifelin homolog B-like [Thalassophryne amazonica]
MTSKHVIQQPEPVMDAQYSNNWETGICGCCSDMTECCFAFWCFPCAACRISKQYGECLCLPLLDIFCGGMIHPINLSMRVAMRQRYGIQGTMCRDCVYTTFCGPCTWCQMAREMKRRRIPVILINAKNT